MRTTLAPPPFFGVSLHISSARLFCCVAVLMLLTLSALLSKPALANPGDPPARVGRIGLVEGDVSFYNDKTEGWRKARLNFPVTSKNSIWTNGPGRAEVSIGASALRIDGDSIIDFSRVDDSRTQVYVQRGTLNVRLRSYPSQQNTVETYRDTFRVETDEGVVILQSNGRYRIDASQDRNETRISVFAGLARFDNGGAALNVEAGKSLVARINNGSPAFNFETAFEQPFDRWAEARDIQWDGIHQRYANERNVSPRMTGYEDLDSYGDWVDDREYGRLWTPRVIADDWAPYRYGAWSYVRPWGWTWVDNATWGFAPFHYGRWMVRGSRWYWWPGAYSYRPVYAPALVGWAGRGDWNISLSIGGGSVGWFPLSPREYYVPAYSNNVTYIRNINNVTNNITIINPPTTFANQASGATVVSNGVMVNGEPVWRNASINNQQAVSMTKPAVDPRSAGNVARVTNNDVSNFGQASLAPPASPSVRTKPAALTAATAVSGQPVWQASPTTPQTGTPQTATSQIVTPRAVVGEAPRPSAVNSPSSAPSPSFAGAKPAQVPQVSQASAAVQDTPQFVRPVKPNPTPTPTPLATSQSATQEPIKVQGGAPIPSPQPRFESSTSSMKKPALLSDTQIESREPRSEAQSSNKERRLNAKPRQDFPAEIRNEARRESRQQAAPERHEGQVKQKPAQDKSAPSGGKVGHVHQAQESNNKVAHQ